MKQIQGKNTKSVAEIYNTKSVADIYTFGKNQQ